MEVFLYIDFFIVGVIAVLVWQYALAHFRPDEHDLEKTSSQNQPEIHLSAASRDRLVAEAEDKLRKILDQSAGKFQKDIEDSESQLIKHIESLSNAVFLKEVDHYKAAISKLEEQAASVTQNAEVNLAKNEAELKVKLETELKAEKQKLVDQINSKISDAVISFILNTLGHNIDLGAQTAYIMAVLEEHKQDFKEGISGEPPIAK